MKFRTRTFLKAALVAVALEAGALGVTNVANAFTLIELLDVTHSAMDFSSVSVNPDIHTPQVNVANVGEEAIKVQKCKSCSTNTMKTARPSRGLA